MRTLQNVKINPPNHAFTLMLLLKYSLKSTFMANIVGAFVTKFDNSWVKVTKHMEVQSY
jgi:hypothetical protein